MNREEEEEKEEEKEEEQEEKEEEEQEKGKTYSHHTLTVQKKLVIMRYHMACGTCYC